MCSLKFRLLSILIHKRFSHSLLEIVSFPIVILLESLPGKKNMIFIRITFRTVAVKPVQKCVFQTSELCITYAESAPVS